MAIIVETQWRASECTPLLCSIWRQPIVSTQHIVKFPISNFQFNFSIQKNLQAKLSNIQLGSKGLMSSECNPSLGSIWRQPIVNSTYCYISIIEM